MAEDESRHIHFFCFVMNDRDTFTIVPNTDLIIFSEK